MTEPVKAEKELRALLASLERSWLVCLTALALALLSARASEGFPALALVRFFATLLAMAYWLVVIRTQDEAARVMRALDISAWYWNRCLWLATFSIPVIGTLLEVAVFSIYARYALRRSKDGSPPRTQIIPGTARQGWFNGSQSSH